MILDTNALSAIVDGDPDIEAVLGTGDLAIPIVVLGEFRYGVAQSRRRNEYEEWLAENLRAYRLLEITEQTTVDYARIRLELKRSGKPIPSNDAWIAALCRQHSLSIVSRDVHFDRVRGVARVGW